MIKQQNIAVHLFGDIFYNVKTKSRTLLAPAVFSTIKLVENKGHILVGYALSKVAEMYLNIVVGQR